MLTVEQLDFDTSFELSIANMQSLTLSSVFIALGLGIALSVLFYMDQNITTLIIHQPTNNLQKSPAYHLDLLVLAVVNGYLSLFGLPWMHAILPQSPM